MLRSIRVPALVAALALFPAVLPAQAPGRLVGRVFDAATGRPIGEAVVEVVGGAKALTSGVDGRYQLGAVAPGVVTLRVSRLGFGPKVVREIAVRAGATTVQDVALAEAAVKLEEITVTASGESGSVNQLLADQRDATGVTSGISRVQIERSPDVDAAAAVARVSGVTVNGGRTVSVRGLAERYSTTTLNGSRLPSPEPERREVPLDLFPSGILDGIRAQKTFTPDRPGDFSGAEVDLRTRDFPSRRTFTLAGWMGANTAVAFRNTLIPYTAGGELLGSVAASRVVPPTLDTLKAISSLSTAQQIPLIQQLQNVWSAPTGTGTPDGSFTANVGGTGRIFGLETGYIASGTYTTQQTIQRNDTRNTPGLATLTSLTTDDSIAGQQTSRTVAAGGLLNLSVRVGQDGIIRSSNTFTRTADNDVQQRTGFTGAAGNDLARTNLLRTTRLAFTQREVRANQLGGEHRILGAGFEWSASNASVSRTEPDRSDFAQRVFVSPAGDTTRGAWLGTLRSANRTFSTLTESNWDLSAAVTVPLGRSALAPRVKVGGNYRTTSRNVKVRSYDYVNFGLPISAISVAPESIFSATNVAAGKLRVQDNPYGGDYDASEQLVAGFGQLELRPSSRLQVITGARLEVDTMRVITRYTIQGYVDRPTGFRTVDWLPAIAVNYRLGEEMQLRFGASRTLSRPNYRELADLIYFEPIGGDVYSGNPLLRRSRITNTDLRWEWYPTSGEVLSVGVFYKDFLDPIEQAVASIAGQTAIRWINNERGTAYGLELEARLGLDRLSPALRTLSAFTNVSVLRSSITVGNQLVTSPPTNLQRPMVGQAPYVINAGLTWAPRGFTATLLYNRTGDRIALAGLGGLPDTYLPGRDVLDATLQLPVSPGFSLRLDGRNLLDAPVQQQQGGFFRRAYSVGRQLRTGFSWTP